MRIKKKTINLEPFISRLPGIIPSYDGDNLLFYKQSDIDSRNGEHITNYGTYPINLWLKFESGSTTNVVNLWNNSEERKKDSNYTGGTYTCFSFTDISKIYAFFQRYYNLLNKEGKCCNVYTSATQYYDTEVRGRYHDDMTYGTDRDTYVKMDEDFDTYHGKIVSTIVDKTVVRVEDGWFYKWLCEYVVPSYTINTSLVDAWNGVTSLYLDDVCRWISWFEGVYACNDCCDLEKAEKMGGENMLESLAEWRQSLNEKVMDNTTPPSSLLRKYWIPKLNFNILATINAKTIGQRRDMVEEYIAGINYNASDVTYYNEKPYKRLNSGDSYVYDETYKELNFNESGWTLTKATKPVQQYEFYAYRGDGAMVTSHTEQELDTLMTYELPLDTNNGNGFIVLSDPVGIYPINKGELLTISNGNQYLNGMTIEVNREDGTERPYVFIGGTRHYAKLQDDMTYSFKTEFGSNEVYPYAYGTATLTSYIIFNGKPTVYAGFNFRAAHGKYDFNGVTYYVYTDLSGINSEDKITPLYPDIYPAVPEGYQTISYNPTASTFVVLPIYQIYSANTVYGSVDSKLEIFKEVNGRIGGSNVSLGRAFDLAGNSIDGILKSDKWVPVRNELLEPVYQPGNVANLSAWTGITQPEPETTIQPNISTAVTATTYLFGDILASMTLYKRFLTGEIDESSKKKVDKLEFNKKYGELSGLTENSGKSYSSEIYCEFKYNIGATLRFSQVKVTQKISNSNTTTSYSYSYSLPVYDYSGITCTKGVEYTEERIVVKKPTTFYTKAGKHTRNYKNPMLENDDNAYQIFIYDFIPVTQDIETNGETVNTPMADFKYNISSDFNSNKNYNAQNVMYDTPKYGDDYDIGIAYPQSVISDIYIDRGINAAFEKHLKIGEVLSLDSLIEYGNGFFSILNEQN